MRSLTLVALFVMIMITSNGWAVEPIDDQQAMFYYQIPFGGIKKADNLHKFGFRIDRVTVDRLTGQYSDSLTFNDLMKRPASLNIQMGHQGIAALKMHGYDYLPQLISRADEEASGDDRVIYKDVDVDVEFDADLPSGEPEAGGPKEGDEEKYLKLPELNQTSFGLLLGVGILIIAITL